MRRTPSVDAVSVLFERYADDLLGFLVYRTNDRGLAEDVLADTFERALRARRRPHGDKERAWLYTIAVNRLRDVHRRAGAETRAYERLGPGAGPIPVADAVEDRDLVRRGLERLPDPEREVIALRFGGGLAVKEIGAVLGERPTTVDGRLHRGLRRLREDLRRPESDSASLVR